MSINSITTLILILTSLYLLYFDIKFKRVPNLINLILFILVLSNKLLLKDNIINPLISGSIAFLTFLLVYIISKGKLGIGDAKYSFIISFHFGYYFWLKSIIYCSVTALILSLILYFSKKITRETAIPFIPFLVFGWYMELFIRFLT